jgi:hypothetical protein
MTLTAETTDARDSQALNRARAWLYGAGALALALVNVWLFRPEKVDLHDPATVAGMLAGGLLTQAVLVAIAYGIHRLLRRPKQPLMVVAFWTLLALTGLRVLTSFLPPPARDRIR